MSVFAGAGDGLRLGRVRLMVGTESLTAAKSGVDVQEAGRFV